MRKFIGIILVVGLKEAGLARVEGLGFRARKKNQGRFQLGLRLKGDIKVSDLGYV